MQAPTAQVMAALAIWAGVHAVVAPLALTDVRLVATVVIDLVAAVVLSAPVLLARARGPLVLGAVLAVAGLLTAGRAVATGQPFSGLDAGVGLLVAALLLSARGLLAVVAVTLAGWAAVTGYAVVHDLQTGQAGEAGPAGQWLYAIGVVAAAAGVAYAVRSMLTAQSAGLDSAREQAEELSVRDPLTGLANRAGIELVAAPMIEHARRISMSCSPLASSALRFPSSRGTGVAEPILTRPLHTSVGTGGWVTIRARTRRSSSSGEVPVPGPTTTNSSPVQRATTSVPRTHAWTISATSRSTASPPARPAASLTVRMPSTSM